MIVDPAYRNSGNKAQCFSTKILEQNYVQFQTVPLCRAMHLDNISGQEKLYTEANDASSGLSKSEGFTHSIKEKKRTQTLPSHPLMADLFTRSKYFGRHCNACKYLTTYFIY